MAYHGLDVIEGHRGQGSSTLFASVRKNMKDARIVAPQLMPPKPSPISPRRWAPRGGFREQAGYNQPFALLDEIDSGYEALPTTYRDAFPEVLTYSPESTPQPIPRETVTASGGGWWEGILNTIGTSTAKILTSKANTAVAVNRAQDIGTLNRYGYNVPLPGAMSTGTILAGLGVLAGAYFLLRK